MPYVLLCAVLSDSWYWTWFKLVKFVCPFACVVPDKVVIRGSSQYIFLLKELDHSKLILFIKLILINTRGHNNLRTSTTQYLFLSVIEGKMIDPLTIIIRPCEQRTVPFIRYDKTLAFINDLYGLDESVLDELLLLNDCWTGYLNVSDFWAVL